jgi:xanthine dehydrogenase accessory factor
MLLIVAESSGSSPGRQGYKMVVASDGELLGSIGGGMMEVNLVERSRGILRDAATGGRGDAAVVEQVHRKQAANASGMICSGWQTVIFRQLTPHDTRTVDEINDALKDRRRDFLFLSTHQFAIMPRQYQNADFIFERPTETEFNYPERLGFENELYIIGGGHCALALSELMSKLDFHLTLFDDRPELNTIAKNEFAHEIKIVDRYELIGDHIFSGRSAYVVVMTLGYKTDEIVIRGLIDKEFKYFGVLGSKAKMSTMFKSLRKDGISDAKLSRIHTPVGLPINSRTPEEIAVSIAAEIISVKNG